MTDLSSIGHGHGNPVGPLNRAGLHSGPSTNGQASHARTEAPIGRDRVELSEHARLLDELRRLPDVRLERVEAVREAIAQDAYETQERLDAAIEKLLEDL